MSQGSTTVLSMWSGPRNISTAMMRAFGSRPDCSPVDEPFYAYYLNETGLDHPLRAEVMASQPQDWQQVAADINAPLPLGKSVRYLKHMTQHMLPQIDRDLFLTHAHCFLIRDPRLVIASFAEKWDQVSAEATGFIQQLELFRYFEQKAKTPCIVIEGEDIQKDPRGMLQALCAALGISFYPEMLQWTAGPKSEDGVWGSHWYNAVEASTGFAPYRPKTVQLTDAQEELADQLMPLYRELQGHKLCP